MPEFPNSGFYTASILIVKNTTFRWIFSSQEMLVVNGCKKCNETTAQKCVLLVSFPVDLLLRTAVMNPPEINTSFACQRKI